jgi:hypothetical protein
VFKIVRPNFFAKVRSLFLGQSEVSTLGWREEEVLLVDYARCNENFVLVVYVTLSGGLEVHREQERVQIVEKLY